MIQLISVWYNLYDTTNLSMVQLISDMQLILYDTTCMIQLISVWYNLYDTTNLSMVQLV